MAKGKVQKVLLVCSVCKERNYVTKKNTINVQEKLALSKFCQRCRAHNTHNEAKLPNPKPR